jgi:hypothetical protein
MATSEILTFAKGPGAFVQTQAQYAADIQAGANTVSSQCVLKYEGDQVRVSGRLTLTIKDATTALWRAGTKVLGQKIYYQTEREKWRQVKF